MVGYCSLVEAFSNPMTEYFDSELSDEKPSLHTEKPIVGDSTISGLEAPHTKQDKPSPVVYNSTKNHQDCKMIWKHIRSCKVCRNYLQSNTMLDLGIYVIGGVFMLFLLDLSMKMGRRRI